MTRVGLLGTARRWLAVRPRVPVPKIGQLTTVQEVLHAHEQHAHTMSGMDLSACWNTLGKLVKRIPKQRHWLDEALR